MKRSKRKTTRFPQEQLLKTEVPTDRLLTPEDIAYFLSCTVKHVYNLASKGLLHGNNACGLRFRAEDLQNFVDEREKRRRKW